jgi:hypothetical protein
VVSVAPEIVERRDAAIAVCDLAVAEAAAQLAADKLAIDTAHDSVFDHARDLLERAETDTQYLEAKRLYDAARIRPRPDYQEVQAKYDKAVAAAKETLHLEICDIWGRSP